MDLKICLFCTSEEREERMVQTVEERREKDKLRKREKRLQQKLEKEEQRLKLTRGEGRERIMSQAGEVSLEKVRMRLVRQVGGEKKWQSFSPADRRQMIVDEMYRQCPGQFMGEDLEKRFDIANKKITAEIRERVGEDEWARKGRVGQTVAVMREMKRQYPELLAEINAE